MGLRWQTILLVTCLLLVAIDAGRGSKSKSKSQSSSRGVGKASRLSALNTARNKNVKQNSAVKNAVSKFKNGRKNKINGNSNQVIGNQNGVSGNQNGLNPANLNQPTILRQNQGQLNAQNQPPSPNNLQQNPQSNPGTQQANQQYQAPLQSGYPAQGGQYPMPGQMPQQGQMGQLQGGWPPNSYPQPPPPGFGQQQAPSGSKSGGLFGPILPVLDIVSGVRLAGEAGKALMGIKGKPRTRQDSQGSRKSATNGTILDSNATITNSSNGFFPMFPDQLFNASFPLFNNSNDSNDSMPMPFNPFYPVAPNGNITGYQSADQFLPSPGMFNPFNPFQNQNMSFPNGMPYPNAMPYPHMNPFYHNNLNAQNESVVSIPTADPAGNLTNISDMVGMENKENNSSVEIADGEIPKTGVVYKSGV